LELNLCWRGVTAIFASIVIGFKALHVITLKMENPSKLMSTLNALERQVPPATEDKSVENQTMNPESELSKPTEVDAMELNKPLSVHSEKVLPKPNQVDSMAKMGFSPATKVSSLPDDASSMSKFGPTSPEPKTVDRVLTISSPAAKNRVPLVDSSDVPWQDQTSPPVVVSSFLKELDNVSSMSKLQQCIAGVEEKTKKRFPDMDGLRPELLEFLSHTITTEDLSPILHPKDLVTNNYVTALPFIHFANLIYSKALIFSVAAQTFPIEVNKKKTKRNSEAINHWGMPIPQLDTNSAYQFWVVHVNGGVGEKYLDTLQVHERTKCYKHRDAVVAFFRSQFDEL
jgi:hypothetical protein